MKFLPILILLLSLFNSNGVIARIHKLEINNDNRKYIALSTFGFKTGGILEVELKRLHVSPFNESAKFGFTLDRTVSDAMNPYLDSHQDRCLLEDKNHDGNGAVTYFILDFKNKRLRVNCSQDPDIRIYRNKSSIPVVRPKRSTMLRASTRYQTMIQEYVRSKREASLAAIGQGPSPAQTKQGIVDDHNCSKVNLPISKSSNERYYNTSFAVYVPSVKEEGLYNLYFHSCPNYQVGSNVEYSFTIEIREDNAGNYLSAGEMPLPALYFTMSILFFLSGCFWVFILRKSKHPVFKIHYLMGALVYLKSFSLIFHGMNYHFIEIMGQHVEAWAVLYYITHLLKGSVLFITIVLVGTGWTFIKHILSEKDKKIFMIVIPLQVLANVAEIIIEESEEGDTEHRTWRDVFILVDLLCCGAILFPVVWSIRHLQEASHIDGKAAMNLRKLKLFRHFYIMIVCYIYFTRIIVYLLKITVPFQYEWLDEMFREMATYVFFVLTGYKFRPASANPYFQVNLDDDDEEMDVVVTQSGLTEGLTKMSRTKKDGKDATEEEKDNLLLRQESSHDVTQSGLTEGLTKMSRTKKDGKDATEEEKDNLLLRQESSHEYD